MFKFALALSLLPLVLSNPQYGGYGPPDPSPSSSSTSSSAASSPSGGSTDASAGQVLVQVGPNGGLTFNPSDIKAAAGTLVTFVFASNIPHSVTQSTFADPCTPIGSNGFDSGLTTGTTFSVNVTDASTPVYFFCKAPAHCGAGMVGTINAPSSGNSNAAFVAAAKAIGSNEAAIPDNGFQTGGQGAVATAGPTSGTPSVAAPSPTPSGSSSSSSASPSPTGSNNNGASHLALSGGAAVMGLVAGLFAYIL